MTTIFLSYAKEDRPRTRRLVQALEARGWSVWWDRTIPPGETFDTVIEKALARSQCVVVLWSKTSISSDWVKTEAQEAARRRILVPALIDDVLAPLEFRRIQAARLVGWNGDQKNEDFNRLIHAISEKLGGAPGETLERPLPPARGRRAMVLGSALGVAAIAAVGAGTIYLRLHRQDPIIIGVMEIHSRGNAPAWMCEFTRDGLNTVLSKVSNVQVYSKQKIDLLRDKNGLSEIEAAERLGITKMISGTISTADQNVVVEVQVVDPKSGMLVTAQHMRGTEAQLIDMENQVAVEVVKVLKTDVTPDELSKLVAARTNDQLDSYKLLTESMGGVVDEPVKPSHPPPPKPAPSTTSWLPGPRAAYADTAGDQRAVQALMEQYRSALESKDVDKLAATYLSMNDALKQALTRYFDTASDLKVRFSDFDILVQGDEAVATFTRKDDFRDQRSGREMHLEVRVSVVAKQQVGTWKIEGIKKTS